jgi:hypothetical protein
MSVNRTKGIALPLVGLLCLGTMLACGPTGTPHSSSAAPTYTPGTLSGGPPDQTMSPAPSDTGSPAPSETYLDEIQEYQVVRGPGTFETGQSTVDGTLHPRSVKFPNPCGQYPEVVDYVLSRRFTTLSAVVGLADNSGADAKVQFEVAADGVSVGGPEVLSIGQHREIRVELRKPVKLRLTTTNVGGCQNYALESATAVWGDAKLIS